MMGEDLRLMLAMMEDDQGQMEDDLELMEDDLGLMEDYLEAMEDDLGLWAAMQVSAKVNPNLTPCHI